MTALLHELAAAPPDPGTQPGPSLQPGQVVGRFELLRELGRGGFGVVWEALDQSLKRRVAFKLVQTSLAGAGAGADQLQREAEVVAKLSHPNLVTLHDVGRCEHGAYLILELLRGETLQARLGRGPVSLEEALAIAIDVSRGLAYAHAEGVVHRDLKPSNVFLCERGGAKLLDFGMAHAFGRRRVSGGTPAYMAPEQWVEDPEDERTDVFALGVMLHRMLSGEYPYPEDGGRWSSGAAEPPGLDVPGAPELGPLVGRMLERAPRLRPRDGAEVLAALERAAAALPARQPAAHPGKATRRRASMLNLVAELKRRRVFRVVVGYGVFSFAVLQVIEPLMHGLHLGDWVLTATIAALALGFPAAVLLSWAYDLTSQGVQRTPSVVGPRAITLSRGRLAALLVGVGLLAALPGLGWYAWRRGWPQGSPAAPAAGPSIAVLPFQDLSERHDQDYFSDGVAEEILNALSHLDGLKVIGRTSSFSFKGTADDLRTIGRKLDVATILEGSLRKDGDQIRVTAQLIRVADGSHLWSESYDRKLAGIFKVQDEIARAVVEALKVKLLPASPAQLPAARATKPEAYRLYLLGRQLATIDEVRSVEEGLHALERAVELDPTYAPALAELGFATYRRSELVATEVEAARAQAMARVQRALALDPDLVEGYLDRGLLRIFTTWEWTGAQADLALALARAPGHADVLGSRARLLATLGRVPEAVRLAQRALEADPLSVTTLRTVGDLQAASGDLRAAEATFRRGLDLAPTHARLLRGLGLVLLQAGRNQEALAIFDRHAVPWMRHLGLALAHHALGQEAESRRALEALVAEGAASSAYQVAQVHAFRGEREEAFAWLERAVRQRDSGIPYLKFDPLLAPLRADPRYQALLRMVNLPAN
jgi:TolB-like protein/tetratricopeptide (TPR) repeat protein